MFLMTKNQRNSTAITAFTPADFQIELPLDEIILRDSSTEEKVPMDVVFIGAGPAGLAGSIELANLVKKDNDDGNGVGDVEIAVLDKAAKIGDHSISGAVVNPAPFYELFPGLDKNDFPFERKVTSERIYGLTKRFALRLPIPPTMKNHENYVASIGEITRWLGDKAEECGVNILPGFPAKSLLVNGDTVVGVKTTPSGLDRSGNHKGAFEPATEISARITVLTEGSRGLLTQSYLQWQNINSENPQIYALGVKELWKVKKSPDGIIHTLGWPLSSDTFGGGFMYPHKDNYVSIGIVAGLDTPDAGLDVHELLQRMKQHKLFSGILDGGEMIEWGAKTIPEGGYFSVPDQLSGDGILLAGDCAGFVDVPSLKGIHYAVQSGIYAAKAAYCALKAGDTGKKVLKNYDTMVRESFIMSDLHRNRNIRLAYEKGLYRGSLGAVLMMLTGGKFPGSKISIASDAMRKRKYSSRIDLKTDGKLTFGKAEAVYKSGNITRDDIPSHLIVSKDLPKEAAEMYVRMCPADVYTMNGNDLIVNAPNCVDCKATDVLGPRWTPREGGSGTHHKLM